VSTVETLDGFVWLEFPETGGTQQFPESAAPLWRARGWRDCDPPAAPSLLKDPPPEDASPEGAEPAAGPSGPEPATEQTSEPKTAGTDEVTGLGETDPDENTDDHDLEA
jgi:hypothetical protein